MNKLKRAIDSELKDVTFSIALEDITSHRKHTAVRKRVRTLLIAAVVTALLSAMSLVSVSAGKLYTAAFSAKEAFVGTVIENDTEKTDYNEEFDTIESIYLPDIPDIFTVTNEFSNEHFVSIKWEDADGNTLEFSQRILAVNEYVDQPDDNLRFIDTDGISYAFYRENKVNTVLWNDYGYTFSLSSDNMTDDELYKLTRTLSKKANEEDGLC